MGSTGGLDVSHQAHFQRRLKWVYHDSRSLGKAITSRKEILSHVQRDYHGWRRRTKKIGVSVSFEAQTHSRQRLQLSRVSAPMPTDAQAKYATTHDRTKPSSRRQEIPNPPRNKAPSQKDPYDPGNLSQAPEHSGNRDGDSDKVRQNRDLDLVVVPRNRGVSDSPEMCVQIGGLREDPFGMLPIERRDHVSKAFDFYATIYFPSAARLANLAEDFHSVYFRTLLQQPFRFEAIIAFSLAIQSLHHLRNGRMSESIFYHANKATAMLRQWLLLGKDAASDEVILTITILAAIAHFTGNFEAQNAHVNGLKSTVALRGGIEKLTSLRGFVRLGVTQVLEGWTARLRMLEHKQHTHVDRKTEAKLFYPDHPFPPPLCRKIGRFAEGFQELALSRKLSVQLIDFLHLTVLYTGASSEEAGTLSTTADEVLGLSGLTTLEHVLGTALTAYTMYTERNLRTPNAPYKLYVQSQFRALAARSDILACNPDALEWACLIFKATTERETESWRWADARLRVMQIGDDRQRSLERAFLPIPKATIASVRGSQGGGH